MKFLAFGDTHGSVEAHEILLQKALEEKPDIMCCIGDFTIFGMETDKFLADLNNITLKTKTKLLMIPGNHESTAKLKAEVKKYSNIIWLHKDTYTFKGFTFIGYGGGGFSEHDDEFVEFVNKLEETPLPILLTHQPPKNTTLDEVWEDHHVGNQDFREYIELAQPIIALSGHIHETFGIQDLIEDSLLLNPGPLGQLIEIPQENEDEKKQRNK